MNKNKKLLIIGIVLYIWLCSVFLIYGMMAAVIINESDDIVHESQLQVIKEKNVTISCYKTVQRYSDYYNISENGY